jgi:hypothetical protein
MTTVYEVETPIDLADANISNIAIEATRIGRIFTSIMPSSRLSREEILALSDINPEFHEVCLP